jgi:cyclopropane fatty-acyl-phospholipid synthase-like methyltransferase
MDFLFISLLLLQLFIILGAGVFFFLGLIGAFITPVPFVPTPRPVARKAIELLNIQPGDTVYDLGCGNGRLVYMMADHYPATTVIGAEKAPLPYLLSQFIARVKPRKNGTVVYKDFDSLDLRDANKVFVYLLPHIMDNLLPKLERELPAGTRLVSCDFIFTHKEPAEVHKVQSRLNSHTLRVYEF